VVRSWSICLQCLESFKSKKDTEVDGRRFQEPDKFLSHLFYPANGDGLDRRGFIAPVIGRGYVLSSIRKHSFLIDAVVSEK